MTKRARRAEAPPLDLFSAGSQPLIRYQLGDLPWPNSEQLLVNPARAQVRAPLWQDLVDSHEALVVAGFASITKVNRDGGGPRC